MPVDRPTFSESWYRVAALRPRLRATIQTHRQHFRGQTWHVLQDPASNQFFRLNEPAYYFVALLDGRKTVARAWQVCNEQLGDAAPTQGEVIQLLGQLYSANLLQAELPPDAESLFRRYSKRVTREVQGYLMNLLFIRIPLIDPDHFLERWVGVAGRIFSFPGLVAWLALLGAAGYFLAGRGAELWNRASGILDPSNLAYLYLAMILIKVCHEFGHAFACKKFGRQSGTGGEVHVMGVMLLIFTPLPYVDASSSWALRSKGQRVVIGAAGMMVELAIAAVAAIIWAHTGQNSPAYAVAYNMMFIAGVSTILFNGNPLLRYDGYYILSDVLEIPNLYQRGQSYIKYFVRRYAWGVRRLINPAHTRGERVWLAVYAVSANVYRVFICAAILIFVAKKLFFIGAVLAVVAAVTWVVVPLGKFAHYLAASSELNRVRGRAVASSLAVLALVLVGVGLVPAPDRYRFEGVVEPARMAFVHAETDGFVRAIIRDTGADVKQDDPLLQAENKVIEEELAELKAERRRLQARKRLVESEDIAAAQAISDQVVALDGRIAHVERSLDSLALKSALDGRWISPHLERLKNSWLARGDRVGLVASVDDLIIRAVAGQDAAAALYDELESSDREDIRSVEIRIKDRPRPTIPGRIEKMLPAGQLQLPSAALGYLAGGSVATSSEDRRGTQAAERFFEIHISPDNSSDLLSGQRVVIRAGLSSKPLIVQWWRSGLRLFQRRLKI